MRRGAEEDGRKKEAGMVEGRREDGRGRDKIW